MMLYLSLGAICLLFSVYSYALIDPNITFFQSKLWVAFRDPLVQFGYYQREYSWWSYLLLVVLLFALSWYAVKKYEKLDALKVALTVGIVTVLSYPFLSHDFFNYMFDARIFTFYHQNPYLFRALDFPGDQWLRFMHWTHRTYPYGPVYLLISIIPSFLGAGKFSLTFLLFKVMNAAFYVLSVWLFSRINRKWAILFATSPLIIIEGLINGHNDMVGLGLAVIGVYLAVKHKKRWSRFILLLAAGIKYINFPALFIGQKKTAQRISLLMQLAVLGYLTFRSEIQPWYFLALFAFLPFFGSIVAEWSIFLFGLLMSYYPYIRLGGWDTAYKVDMKHQIIIAAFAANLIYILLRSKKKFFRR